MSEHGGTGRLASGGEPGTASRVLLLLLGLLGFVLSPAVAAPAAHAGLAQGIAQQAVSLKKSAVQGGSRTSRGGRGSAGAERPRSHAPMVARTAEAPVRSVPSRPVAMSARPEPSATSAPQTASAHPVPSATSAPPVSRHGAVPAALPPDPPPPAPVRLLAVQSPPRPDPPASGAPAGTPHRRAPPISMGS